jgi:membrane protease YdiL (CAAX protease family)
MTRTPFAQRHPYWFVAGLEIVTIAVYLLVGTVAYFTQLSNNWIYGSASLILSLIAALLLTRLGWWKVVGFRSPNQPRDLWYFALPLLPAVITLLIGVEVTSLVLLAEFFVITLLIGFAEEAIFRGLMLNALKAAGFWQAAIITALLFGLSHALNGLAGKSMAETGAQIFYAVAFGFAFAALVLKKGILWPLVLVHFLIDFASFLQRPDFIIAPHWNLLLVVGLAFIFTAYGAFVMLQKPRGNVFALRESTYGA